MGIPKEVTKILEKHNIDLVDFVNAMKEIKKLASLKK